MKLLVAAVCLALISSVAFATEFWVPAIYIGYQRSRDPVVIRCFYKTLGGYQFALAERGLCHLSRMVNPDNHQIQGDTGAQRRPQPRPGRPRATGAG